MGVYQASVVLPRPREDAFDYLRRPSNLLKMFPPNAADDLSLKVPEIMNLGGCIEFHVKAMGSKYQFVHEIIELTMFERILMRQIKGPFKSWTHEQHFADATDGHTLLTSTIRFDPPGGMLGFIVTRKLVLAELEKWIGKGHEMLRKEMSLAAR